jgi:hypothetical protein
MGDEVLSFSSETYLAYVYRRDTAAISREPGKQRGDTNVSGDIPGQWIP